MPEDILAGDIFIACDNVFLFKNGYMGHSAIAYDATTLIESAGFPAIRPRPVSHFLEKHPLHAHYRPRSPETGRKAALYAREYLQKYRENLKHGIERPRFSFSLFSSLDNPWDVIYCSKLVWLCYHHGADCTLKNDFLWFAPEDLYRALERDPRFQCIYRHPKFSFQINL
jgi:hypothetical protein